MSNDFKVGTWCRINDGTYRVGVIKGTGYGNEVLVVTAPYGQIVDTRGMEECVTIIPTQTGDPPDLRWSISGVELKIAKAEILAAHPGTKGEGEAAQAAVVRLKKKKS